jgi:hypothetical protein
MPGTNTLAYLDHLEVAKKKSVCECVSIILFDRNEQNNGGKIFLTFPSLFSCMGLNKEHYLNGKAQYG